MRVQVRRAIEVVERLYHGSTTTDRWFWPDYAIRSSESVYDVIPPGESGYLNVAASGQIVGHSDAMPKIQLFGSMPMLSLTAARIRSLRPRYRSVV